MRRVAVTGAGGFIGSHLVRALRARGCWVRGVDLEQPEFGASEADEFLLLDLSERAACLRATASVDLVFALAANMGGIGWTHTAAAEILRDNLLISTSTLEACRRNRVTTVVYASSACVYPCRLQQHADSPALREEPVFPADPDMEYGWEKLTAEILCRTYRDAYGTDVKVARLHAIYGPGGTYQGPRAKSLAALCAKVAAIEGPAGEIEVWGDGSQTRSYCYIDDCVEGLWRLARSGAHTPVNLGSEERVSIDELVRRIARVARKSVTIRHAPERPVGPLGRSSDNALCRRLLGWAPSIPLDAGLPPTYRWIEERLRAGRAAVGGAGG